MQVFSTLLMTIPICVSLSSCDRVTDLGHELAEISTSQPNSAPSVRNWLDRLRQLDQSPSAYYPEGFDYELAVRRFHALAEILQQTLGVAHITESEELIQDASFHSQIIFELENSAVVLVRLSNFGDLVAMSANADQLTPSTKREVLQTIEHHGYQVVPMDIVHRPYSGTQYGAGDITTWWRRFFDYL